MDPPLSPSDSDSDDQIAVKTASEPEKPSSEPTKSSKTSATTSGVRKKDFCAIKVHFSVLDHTYDDFV